MGKVKIAYWQAPLIFIFHDTFFNDIWRVFLFVKKNGLHSAMLHKHSILPSEGQADLFIVSCPFVNDPYQSISVHMNTYESIWLHCQWIHISPSNSIINEFIWVGFTRTGILAVLCHFKKNFAWPMWPNLISYATFFNFSMESMTV